MFKRTRNEIIEISDDDEEENDIKHRAIQIKDPNQLTISDKRSNNSSSNFGDNSFGNSIQDEIQYGLKYLQFKEIQLDNIKIEELKKQAEQYGLSVSGGKNEIYSRIENYLLYKRDLLNISKIQIEKEVDSFKKEQPKLLILNGISQNELLFWRVFRSKPIFKKIFSNFQTSESNNYDQLYSVYIIMKHFSNGLEIIKDKIKSNSFLSFKKIVNPQNQNSNISLNYNPAPNQYINCFDLICDQIKQDTEENRELISNLLQNYQKSIHFYQMLESSIECSNIFLFNLLKQLEPIYNKSTLNGEFLINTFTIDSYQKVKMGVYLKSKGYNYFRNASLKLNIDYSTLKLKQLIKILSFLVKYSYFQSNESERRLIQLKLNSKFTNEQLNSTLKELLEPLSSIINSKSKSNIIDKLEIEKYKYLNKNQLSTLSKEELVDTLDFFKTFYCNQNLKTQILQYCEFYYNLNTFRFCPIDYIIYFKTEKELYETQFFSKDLGDLFNLSDLDTQKDMIDSIKFISLDEKIKCAIKSNSLQLIDYTLKSTEFSEFQTSLQLQNMVIESIESKQVLDYLFKNYNSIFFKSIDNNYWVYVSSLELLEHYEHLMKSINSTFIFCIRYNFPQHSNQNLSHSTHNIFYLKKIIRALNNPSLYILEQIPPPQQQQQQLIQQLPLSQQMLYQRELLRALRLQRQKPGLQQRNLTLQLFPHIKTQQLEELGFNHLNYIIISLMNFQPELIIELIRTERFKIINAEILFTVFNYPSYHSSKTIHSLGSLNTISKWLLNRCINYPNYLQENEHGIYELSIKINLQDIQLVCKNKTILIQLLYHAGHYDDIFLISNLESKDFVPLFSSTGGFVNRISLKFVDELFKYIFENNIETPELIHSIYHQIIQSNNVPLLKLIDSKYLKSLIGGNQYKRTPDKNDYLINDSDIQNFLGEAQQLDHCEIFIIISNHKPVTKPKPYQTSQSYSLVNDYLNQ